MQQRNISFLVGILILTAALVWINLPDNPGLHLQIGSWTFDRDISVHQGLDLRGGTQVVLEAVPGEEQELTQADMEASRKVIENRVNGLGVTEPLVQLQGEKRIIVELPGVEDPDQAIATIKETGLLEFVEAGSTFLPEGAKVRTSEGDWPSGMEVTGTLTFTEAGYIYPDRVFPTLMTGKHLKDAGVSSDQNGNTVISFELTKEGADIFSDYTREHVGQVVAILLDKEVLSAPRINEAIPSGRGIITSGEAGGFPLSEARKIAVQMRYGALSVPLTVVENRTIGPTLGQDSVQKSVRAGTIGVIVVLLFMVVYYRLPGFLADLALIIYAMLNFALYKTIPVTLTLPAITGFLLSTGMAVDANILVFERMKEELRAGRSLHTAMEAGFSRAWTSIRDSNLSTLLTCAVLYWFGSNFGASIVKGFAITLALGVVVNIFTAITVTRTFIRFAFALMGESLKDMKHLMGV